MQDFQTFDLVILAIVVLLGLKGILNGLVKEVFGLIGIIGGIYIASTYSVEIGLAIGEVVPFKNNNAIAITGFVIGLAIFWAGSVFLGKIFSNLTKASGLGGINSILGFVASAGKIFLIFSIIAFAASSIDIINKNSSKFFENSKIYPILVETGSHILKFNTDVFTKKTAPATTMPPPSPTPIVTPTPTPTPAPTHKLVEQIADIKKSVEDISNEMIKEVTTETQKLVKTIEDNLSALDTNSSNN